MKHILKNIVVCLLLLTVACGMQAQEPAEQAVTPLNGGGKVPLTQSVADMVIDEAMRYIGTPYRWGGKSPSGFDCAGFTRYIYGHFGLQLAPSAAPQYKAGPKVDRDELQRGDLVFFNGRGGGSAIGHVGIVTSVGSNGFEFIHAASNGITITSSQDAYYVKRYVGACRVVDQVVANRPAISNHNAYDAAIPVRIVVGEHHAVSSLSIVDTMAERSDFVTVAMVGDMMLGTTYPKPRLPQQDGKQLFDHVRTLLRGADIAVGNCEGSITDKGTTTKDKRESAYCFQMPPSYASLFRDAGFDFLSLANNHSYDFGREGMRESMRHLDSMQIRYAGIRDLCRTATLERSGVRYGFCAFSYTGYSCRMQDERQVKQILHELRDSCDILIVSFHGGGEGVDHTHLPEEMERFLDEDRGAVRRFAHLCIDEGADLVYGHGPHVCRAVENYKGHFIAYSLGNFCTPVGIGVSGVLGYAPVVVVRLDRKGRFLDGRIHSFIQPYGKGPRLDSENRVAQFIRSLTHADIKEPHLKILDDGTMIARP